MEVIEGTATVDDVGEFVADLDEIGERHGVTVQAFDARYVVDRAHLERAVDLAARAFDRDEGVADDFGVEILLYAAGRRQINRALEMGVGEGDCRVVAVAVDTDDPAGSGSTEAERDATEALRDHIAPAPTLGEYDEPLVREFFDVGDAELAATAGTLADLVRERVALLVVEK